MEEDNIHVDMEEDLTYGKRPYRCVKRPETTDTENNNDSSESITSLESLLFSVSVVSGLSTQRYGLFLYVRTSSISILSSSLST
jgi:hypothetical protein